MKNKMNYRNQMNVLMDGIRKSYADWNGNPVDSKDEVRLNMIDRFNSTIRIDNGRKFDKIVTGTSVWGFVAKDDGMFKNMPMKKGDVFKPAGWRAPAKHKRGTIFTDDLMDANFYSWTGPNYLK